MARTHLNSPDYPVCIIAHDLYQTSGEDANDSFLLVLQVQSPAATAAEDSMEYLVPEGVYQVGGLLVLSEYDFLGRSQLEADIVTHQVCVNQSDLVR